MLTAHQKCLGSGLLVLVGVCAAANWQTRGGDNFGNERKPGVAPRIQKPSVSISASSPAQANREFEGAGQPLQVGDGRTVADAASAGLQPTERFGTAAASPVSPNPLSLAGQPDEAASATDASFADQPNAAVNPEFPDTQSVWMEEEGQTVWQKQQRAKLPQRPPVMPVAFSESVPPSVPLTPELERQIESVREKFAQDIRADDLPPSDPDYKQRWLRAQPVADQLLRALVGQQQFAAYQLQAWREKTAQANQADAVQVK